jgi:hypothetical protein
MSIFGNIASAIFGHGSAAATKAAVGSAAAPSAPAAKAAPPAGGAPATSATAGSAAAPGAAAAKGGPPAGGAPATGKLLTRDQVEETIKKIADAQNEAYNWKQSIVDLMKLLKLDSSLTARKQLAQELGYKGELTGSAEMNIWLHEQVMQKLAESGGVVPDSIKHV